jgi:hypothetical protein
MLLVLYRPDDICKLAACGECLAYLMTFKAWFIAGG